MRNLYYRTSCTNEAMQAMNRVPEVKPEGIVRSADKNMTNIIIIF